MRKPKIRAKSHAHWRRTSSCTERQNPWSSIVHTFPKHMRQTQKLSRVFPNSFLKLRVQKSTLTSIREPLFDFQVAGEHDSHGVWSMKELLRFERRVEVARQMKQPTILSSTLEANEAHTLVRIPVLTTGAQQSLLAGLAHVFAYVPRITHPHMACAHMRSATN